eukprot:g6587.t1
MNRKNSKGGGKKRRVEVVFDPDARKDYLTGFHKRKLARRRFGLAMQEIKDRKERLEERKERREAMKERREELGVQEDLESFDIKAKAREEAKAKVDDLVQVDFDDGHTQAMFGDTVTVTTAAGIPDSDDEEDARETARLEKELLQEKKRKRAEKRADWNGGQGAGAGRGGGAGRGLGRGGVAGDSEGAKEERWSLAAVSKRLAAKMPAKSRKGAAKHSVATSEKGKKGKKGKKAAAAAGGGATGAALMDKARGSMPRAELGKAKKRSKRR